MPQVYGNGTSGGGIMDGRYVSSPDQLTKIQISNFGNRGLFLPENDNQTDATNFAFWTALSHDSNKEGAYAEVSTSDTYVTVCDISGSGVMGCCFSAMAYNGSPNNATIRLTVDGEVYTYTHTLEIYSRMFIGTGIPRKVYTAVAIGAPDNNNLFSFFETGSFTTYDIGSDLLFSGDKSSSRTYRNDLQILPTWVLMSAWNMPLLKFETELKMETKVNSINTTDYRHRGGITYYLF